MTPSHMTIDYFKDKSKTYHSSSRRVKNVTAIAAAINKRIKLNDTMRILDFGSGTGLLLERIAPFVGHVTAVDTSPSMNAELAARLGEIACPIDILAIDLTNEAQTQYLDGQFDGIISSMTLHHIQDIPHLLQRFMQLLKPQGFIALADLDQEDGSFHKDNTGVHHFGFTHDTLGLQAKAAGFTDIRIATEHQITKPERSYGVWLLTAHKP